MGEEIYSFWCPYGILPLRAVQCAKIERTKVIGRIRGVDNAHVVHVLGVLWVLLPLGGRIHQQKNYKIVLYFFHGFRLGKLLTVEVQSTLYRIMTFFIIIDDIEVNSIRG